MEPSVNLNTLIVWAFIAESIPLNSSLEVLDPLYLALDIPVDV